MRRFVFLLLLLLPFSLVHAEAPRTFREAKKIAWKIYAERPVDFYCHCAYQGNRIDLESCGYQPRKNANRAGRVEWEHIVPAWVIGHQRQCWQDGGRKNCTANDPVFSQAEADLHNLVPVVGEVNGDRSNFGFGMLTEKPSQYGACPFVIDFQQRTAMPADYSRGTIARTYLYMSQRYQLRLSRQDQRLYEIWNRQYPVSEWELWRNQRIACVQGNANPLVGEVDLRRCGKK
ncbi:endonuclease I family protein [Azotobacter beijerinckii]|uniref:endonuclease I family protein n=1 Tax=Azotobacter beijerinckii TaxID=170623 RepID=UPI002952A1CE|nr:endonuclease I family protein [Azotobacter beijerinckii]MDV7210721.1 endonuclease I family protein [Azotobacter beijerinckii]